jgi:hypothetical protein
MNITINKNYVTKEVHRMPPKEEYSSEELYQKDLLFIESIEQIRRTLVENNSCLTLDDFEMTPVHKDSLAFKEEIKYVKGKKLEIGGEVKVSRKVWGENVIRTGIDVITRFEVLNDKEVRVHTKKGGFVFSEKNISGLVFNYNTDYDWWEHESIKFVDGSKYYIDEKEITPL